jgi:hypothetical protein
MIPEGLAAFCLHHSSFILSACGSLPWRRVVDEVDIMDAVDKWDSTMKSPKADERGEGIGNEGEWWWD